MRIVGVQITKRRLAVTGGLMLTSALGGGGIGYFVAMKQLETKYAKISEMEIAEARERYKRLNKVEEYSTVDEAAENLLTAEALAAVEDLQEQATVARTNYGAAFEEPAIVENEEEAKDEVSDPRPPIIVNNVFVNPPEEVQEEEPDNFDYEAELRNRSEDFPYIITHDEFLENEREYEQVSVTFYEDDGMLTDAHDKPIPNSDEMVGDVNLNRFGYGSKDNNIVFIRNEKMGVEFEVARSFGSYAEEVLGFKHSDDRHKIRKFRGDDE